MNDNLDEIIMNYVTRLYNGDEYVHNETLISSKMETEMSYHTVRIIVTNFRK